MAQDRNILFFVLVVDIVIPVSGEQSAAFVAADREGRLHYIPVANFPAVLQLTRIGCAVAAVELNVW